MKTLPSGGGAAGFSSSSEDACSLTFAISSRRLCHLVSDIGSSSSSFWGGAGAEGPDTPSGAFLELLNPPEEDVPMGCIFHRLILCLALGWDKGGLLQLICAGEEPLVRCLRDLSSQDGPSFFLPLHEARQVLCHGGLCLSLGLCNRGTSVGGGVHGFDRRGKKDFRLQDRRSRGPLEPKWWPKWILIKSQDKRPPAVNALAHSYPNAIRISIYGGIHIHIRYFKKKVQNL